MEEEGLEEACKVSGFHDELLGEKRAGQRSIRPSKAYRAIYRVDDSGAVVEEVSKHDY